MSSLPRCKAVTADLSRPERGQVYVAGIDVAGEASEAGGPVVTAQEGTAGTPRWSPSASWTSPIATTCRRSRWSGSWSTIAGRGESHAALHAKLMDLLRDVWRCRRVVVDATGLGHGVASFLERALGKGVVRPFVFTAQSKSRLAFDLLAAVNSGRLKAYASDGSAESQEFHAQMARARGHFQGQPDNEFLRRSRAGPRRLRVEPGPAGECGRVSTAACPWADG